MWEKIRVIFTIPELRNKILLTLILLAIYRVGFWIPLPIVDSGNMQQFFSGQSGEGLGRMINQIAMFSATQLSQATIFGLGIMPYISASIIFQLLASVWKPLEELKKEGPAGQKKINEYTRYATVVICLGQSWFYVAYLASVQEPKLIRPEFFNAAGSLAFHWQVMGVLTMTAGTVFLMWLGEQIDEYGIGNGISLLIMAGILARMPSAASSLFTRVKESGLELGSDMGIERLLLLVILFVAVIAGVVFITQAQRRIPTQSAKHVRGRRVYGGGRQYLPLQVNQAGVMPIIFASSLLMFPAMIFGFLADRFDWSILRDLFNAFQQQNSLLYNLLYVALIYFFCYFWTAITFNPKEMSENLKNYGTFIPGYRPGKRTADYLEKVMTRITYVGAGFLALVAIAPTLIYRALGVDYVVASFFGGTALLIAVSVALDFVKKIDSHLVMRNYRGLLEKT
jgi:preprotein translocase subunit SecY